MLLNEFAKNIAEADKKAISEKANIARGDILTMTTLSASGHPGGSMSTIDLLCCVYAVANISPNNINDDNRDRVVVSNGHISPAVYSCLSAYGFIPKDDAISTFRKAGSIYEGHIERYVNGVEWTTGNLGQGLSVGAGFAVAGKVKENDFDVYVFMGDGEQQKGQITEARRFVKKYGLNNVTVIVDYNKLQISGNIEDVMPSMDIAASFKSDGWEVIEIDGHNIPDIFGALLKAKSADVPVAILARTVMGKGVSFMENEKSFHGSTLSEEKYIEAMKELNLEPNLDYYKDLRSKYVADTNHGDINKKYPKMNLGTPKTYAKDVQTDTRSAFGAALDDIAAANNGKNLAVYDCDLSGSVKTNGIEKNFPNNFFQAGISEHHTAVCAGATSSDGVLTFFAGFGMFGVDEVYNQQRLNGLNEANLKTVTTHVGIDVGEDGKTHMCIDYLGLMRNVFGLKVITPADPNEVDRAIRYAVEHKGNVHVAMGRSKVPVITDDNGKEVFAHDYKFEYGKPTLVRGGDYPLLAYGVTVGRAVEVRDILAKQGISVAVINVSSPTFIDDKYVDMIFSNEKIFVYEDHQSISGLYSTVAMKAVEKGIKCKVYPYGVNSLAYSGETKEVFKLMELDPESVAKKIASEVAK